LGSNLSAAQLYEQLSAGAKIAGIDAIMTPRVFQSASVTSLFLLLVLLSASTHLAAANSSTEAGAGVPLAKTIIAKQGGSKLIAGFYINGKFIGSVAASFKGLYKNENMSLVEDIRLIVTMRTNRLKSFLGELSAVHVVLFYSIAGDDGEVSRGVYYLRPIGGVSLSRLLPHSRGEGPHIYSVNTLELVVLAEKGNNTLLVAAVDLARAFRDNGLPLAISPNYLAYVPKIDCKLTDIKLVKCSLNNMKGYRFAEVYIVGEPSLFEAYRLYVNPVALTSESKIPFNISITLEGTATNNTMFNETVYIYSEKPIALHNLVPKKPALITRLIVSINTTEEERSVNIADLLGGRIALTPPPRKAVFDNATVRLVDGNQAVWIARFTDMIAARPVAGIVEGALFWNISKTSPAELEIAAILPVNTTQSILHVAVIFDDGSIAKFNLTPPVLTGLKYIVDSYHIEAMVSPGEPYYTKRLEKLEKVLYDHTAELSSWEEYNILSEVNRLKRSLTMEDIPRLIAYGFLGSPDNIDTSRGLLIVFRGVDTGNYTGCAGDVFILVGRGDKANSYFVEAPVARIALVEGDYGVYVKPEQLRLWLQPGSDIHVLGVSLHTDCPQLSLESIEIRIPRPIGSGTGETTGFLGSLSTWEQTAIVIAFIAATLAVSSLQSIRDLGGKIRSLLSSLI